jgi:hypothetical protein
MHQADSVTLIRTADGGASQGKALFGFQPMVG